MEVIVEARPHLWPLCQVAMDAGPNGSLTIRYPEKVIVKDEVIQDEFPERKGKVRT